MSGTWLHACPGKIKIKKFISQTRWQCSWDTITISFKRRFWLLGTINAVDWCLIRLDLLSWTPLIYSLDRSLNQHLYWLPIESSLSVGQSVGLSLTHMYGYDLPRLPRAHPSFRFLFSTNSCVLSFDQYFSLPALLFKTWREFCYCL